MSAHARTVSPIAKPGGGAALFALLPLFRGTPRTQLAELARRAVMREAPAGSAIVRRGERLEGLMVVRYGLVKLSLHGESERVLRLVGAGDSFGEAALFLDQPLPLDATAVTDTTLLVVPAAPLLEMFDRDPRFARALLTRICQRFQAMVAEFESATVHGAGERLAAYIESLAPPGAAPASAQLPAPKAVIASRLGMTKETLSRLLRIFMDQGLISVVKREIRVLDRAGLSAAARRFAP